MQEPGTALAEGLRGCRSWDPSVPVAPQSRERGLAILQQDRLPPVCLVGAKRHKLADERSKPVLAISLALDAGTLNVVLAYIRAADPAVSKSAPEDTRTETELRKDGVEISLVK
jgi:hypothetical protein